MGKIGFVMDPIDYINPVKDTTFGMMLSAQSAGHDIFYILQKDLFFENNLAAAHMTQIEVIDVVGSYYSVKSSFTGALSDLDQIFMRVDPPVNDRYIYATHILDKVDRKGVQVVNSPQALRSYNEKLYATEFPDFIPYTCMTADKARILDFIHEHKNVVLKPVGLMAGKEIFYLDHKDLNLDVIIDMQTVDGTIPVIVQPYLKDIEQGDRRVLMINGEAYPLSVARFPKKGSIRANLAAGGTYKVQDLTKKEREIAEAVGPRLVQDGVLFAGLDIIGGHLIEINITSPTGLREITQKTGEDITQKLFEM